MLQLMTPMSILSFRKQTIEQGYQSQLKAQMPEDRAIISSSQIQVCSNLMPKKLKRKLSSQSQRVDRLFCLLPKKATVALQEAQKVRVL